ncbi:sensor domain-containing protein [Streptacidiphilus sp. PAMC 29251]
MSSMADSQQYRDVTYKDTARQRPQRPGFMTAPFEGLVWRESLHMLVNLPVGIVTFTYAVAMLSLGTATVLTFVGLPILAAALLGCRAFGAVERARARATLGLDVAAPERRRRTRPGLTGWIAATLKSGPGWRSALYSLLMLPMGVLSFSVTAIMWIFGIGYGSYPLWQWVFPTT